MKIRLGWRAAALCAALTVTQTGHAADDAPLKVYLPGELPLARYTVIKRLWVEMPESAFWVKSHPESGQAIAALVNEAARLNADGVVNLHCLNGAQFMPQPAAWYCYGNAIKLKQP